MKINCQNCGAKLNIPELLYGKKGKCPKCGEIIPIPVDEIPVLTVSEEPVLEEIVGHVHKTIRQSEKNEDRSLTPVGTKKVSRTRMWLWAIGTIAVFAFIAKLFLWPNIDTNKEKNIEPAKQEEGWFVLAELSGTGKKKSDLFKITGEKLKLTYSVEGSASDDPMFNGTVTFAVFVVREGTTKNDHVIQEVMTPHAESDVIYFEKEPGNYFLDVRAMTSNRWAVKIEEYRSSHDDVKKEGKEHSMQISKCIGETVYIPPGEFMMGCSPGDSGCDSVEKPTHNVKITKGFKMDKCEVTQGEYQRVTGSNPSEFKNCGNECPVENVTWFNASDYCKKAGKRLPTEAEWEYAARGGATTRYYWGDEMDEEYAWYRENSGNTTHPVGQKKPNQYGLNDMLGNAYEWVSDWNGEYYLGTSPNVDPQGPNSGEYHVMRGGAWLYLAEDLRVSYRLWDLPDAKDNRVGFRCAKDMK